MLAPVTDNERPSRTTTKPAEPLFIVRMAVPPLSVRTGYRSVLGRDSIGAGPSGGDRAAGKRAGCTAGEGNNSNSELLPLS